MDRRVLMRGGAGRDRGVHRVNRGGLSEVTDNCVHFWRHTRNKVGTFYVTSSWTSETGLLHTKMAEKRNVSAAFVRSYITTTHVFLRLKEHCIPVK